MSRSRRSVRTRNSTASYCGLNNGQSFRSSRDTKPVWWLRAVAMLGQGGPARDRAMVAVAKAGALRETGEACEPYHLIDPARMPAETAAAHFRDLQAAERSAWHTIPHALRLLTLG